MALPLAGLGNYALLLLPQQLAQCCVTLWGWAPWAVVLGQAAGRRAIWHSRLYVLLVPYPTLVLLSLVNYAAARNGSGSPFNHGWLVIMAAVGVFGLGSRLIALRSL